MRIREWLKRAEQTGPATRKPPGNGELIAQAIREAAHDPRDLSELPGIEAHFGAAFFDNDIDRAKAILREERINPEALARAHSALTWQRLKHKAVDAVPSLYMLTAWLAGQTETPPSVPKSPLLTHGAQSYVSEIQRDLTHNPRNLQYLHSVERCLKALFFDHDEDAARQAGATIPLDVLLRTDAALFYLNTLLEAAEDRPPRADSDVAGDGSREVVAQAVEVLHAREAAISHAETVQTHAGREADPRITLDQEEQGKAGAGPAVAVLHAEEAENSGAEPVKTQAGHKGGRKPKLIVEQQSEARRLRAEGMDNAAIARVLNVSRSTISRLLKDGPAPSSRS